MGASFPTTLTALYGPRTAVLDPATPASLSVRVPLDYAARWRMLLRNLGAAAITAVTLAEAPAARFDATPWDPTSPAAYGPASASLGSLAAGSGKLDVQPPTGVPDCAASALLVFTVAALTTVEITVAGV